ncbi:MAG: DUF2939 domain-containing protein [Gammaproteobacteria bacterium]|nr:DUF2939 domain-containing protein [Gammaproteobacteria bacterium]MCP5138165.1 DUF2939 domain-containing protein [Gammaproteobacteria bacterium]
MKKLLSSLILIAAILWVAYPYAQIYRLDQALQANDKATLAALIDIATVKEDQRTRIEQRANSAIGQGDDPISSMLRAGAKRLGESAVDTVVDVDWVRGQLAGAEARKGQFPPLVGRIDYAFFDNWNRFMVRVGELGRNPLHFRLGFADWQWRVVAIYPG